MCGGEGYAVDFEAVGVEDFCGRGIRVMSELNQLEAHPKPTTRPVHPPSSRPTSHSQLPGNTLRRG